VSRLILVRHGRTLWNAENRGQGQTDIPLDAVGREQAAAAGAALALLKPSVVWSSDLSRARDTAAAVGLPVVTDPRLREIDLGRYEGLTPAEWEADDPVTYKLWRSGHDVRRGGGETYAEVGVRAAAAVKEALASVADPWGLTVIVAHGGTIRALLVELLALPTSPWSHLHGLNNTACADLVHAADGRGWQLLAYGVPASLRLPGAG
jgi:broad specificity phosphatase PhoE